MVLLVAAGVVVLVLATFARDLAKGRGVTEPLGRVTGLYGRFLVLYLGLAALQAKDGFYGNASSQGSICVDSGISGRSPSGEHGWFAKPGASLSRAGNLQVCALHPGAVHWTLFLLTKVPGLVFWGCVVLMTLRLVRQAVQHGPFTPRGAALMRQLGWVIIAGSMAAAALAELGGQLMTDMLVTHPPFGTVTIVFGVLGGAARALVPVPLLAGAALITFGRITGAGAVLDEEVRATV